MLEHLQTVTDIAGAALSALAAFSQLEPLRAQIPTPGGGGELRGAVGNMVAAYLQTKGLVDQAKILTDFKTVLETIAALFWLFSACLGIGAFAIFGNYRQAIYLLIGPALFFFMITATAETTGTEVRFGSFTIDNAEGEQSELLRYIRAIDADTGATRNVSRFFALWDAIVSEGVQMVVDLIIDTENRDHLRFVGRERMLSYVLHSSGDHSGFNRMLGAIFFGECGYLMPELQRLRALKKHEVPLQIGTHQTEQLSETVLKDAWTRPAVALDIEAKRFLIAMKQGGIAGFENVPITDEQEEFIPSCEVVWGYVRSAAMQISQRRLTLESMMGYFTNAGDTEYPLQQMLDDVQELLASQISGQRPARERARDLVGAYVFKNAFERGTVGALSSQVFSRTPFNASYHDNIEGVLSKTEGHSGFMKLKYFADTIPYVQGFLLYLLAIAFPFFAIFLVVPSRATSFLAWMGMWAWVKSWDVGFASVHVARDIMWKVMAEQVNIHGEDLDWSDPVSIISVLYNNDPFKSQDTYWMIISTLTLAIPFVTAHFFLGATGMFDMFSGTIDATADRFGQIERNRSRRFVANVNEHFQRVAAVKSALAYAEANMQRAPLSEQELAQLQASGHYDRGPTDAMGRGVIQPSHNPSGNAITASQLHQGVRAFQAGRMKSQLGTRGFNSTLAIAVASQQQRADQAGNGPSPSHGHVMRGLIADEARIDSQSAEAIFGTPEIADRMVANGTTWGQVWEMNSQYQLNNQALTASATGRRMMNPLRMARDAEKLVGISMQQAQFQRDPESGMQAANTPLIGEVLEVSGLLDYLSDLRSPSTDSFSGTSAPIKKD